MFTSSFIMPNDLSDLCRVCLQLPEESQYLDLTTIYDEEDNLTYGECFFICTQIDLNDGEGVPHQLCKTCGLELQMSYDFHKKIEESKRVIAQCQKQIQEQKATYNANDLLVSGVESNKETSPLKEEENGITHLINNNKYIISEEEMELESGPSSSASHQEQQDVMQHINEQTYENTGEINEEATNEIDIVNKMNSNDLNVGKEDHKSSLEEVNFVTTEQEEHLEVDDYQNLEALEEEETHARLPLSATTVNNPELQNFVFINAPDFYANVQKYETILTEETLIVEEISQDATEKWLDTLNYIDTKSISNSDTNITMKIKEIPQDNVTIEVSKTGENVQETLVTKISKKLPTNYITKSPTKTSKALSKQERNSFCEICKKSFVSYYKLSWHMRMHDKNRKRFVCPIELCGRIYASKQACDLHYRQTHLDDGFICSICHKIFPTKQTLEVHVRYHNREFPYQCNLCERKFAQKGHLTHHVEVKHQNLRYFCTEPDCGKIFQTSVSLRNHQYTHTSMPFKCNHCDKAYPQKNKLRSHLLHKHNLDLSLDDLESMRQFNIIRTRHAFVKVQTEPVKQSINISSSKSTSSNVQEDIISH
ncbi:uncharacterized protein ACRADG_010606 isoform 1-T1 [Cochliomyia hominivorax]